MCDLSGEFFDENWELSKVSNNSPTAIYAVIGRHFSLESWTNEMLRIALKADCSQ
jgi:hypothetical protein